jgi:hypothetical protein
MSGVELVIAFLAGVATPSAYAYGLALALPEAVMARTTGVERADGHPPPPDLVISADVHGRPCRQSRLQVSERLPIGEARTQT